MTTRLTIAAALILASALSASAQRAASAEYISPDHRLKAVVFTSSGESRVSIFSVGAALPLASHAFTSEDKQHGYEIEATQWTPNSQYFVFRLRSSGGHSPMFAPIVFWKRGSKGFYSLRNFTGDIAFEVAPPDRIRASNYPDMTDATVVLRSLKSTDVIHIPANLC